MTDQREGVSQLGWLEAGGSHRELGLALGRRGRRAVHERLLATLLWREVTAPRHTAAATCWPACLTAVPPWCYRGQSR